MQYRIHDDNGDVFNDIHNHKSDENDIEYRMNTMMSVMVYDVIQMIMM